VGKTILSEILNSTASPFNIQICYIYSQIALREEPLSPFYPYYNPDFYTALMQGERHEKYA
jgi:hypothetical protein